MKKILLSFAVIFALTTNAQILDCSDLFISEYVEGPGNNNAIEIYNPTNNPIDLAGYTINRYSNGANSNPETWQLGGTIGSGQTIVAGNGQLDSVWVTTYWSLPVDPAFFALLDDHCNGDYAANSTFYFNGDDAITLEYQGNIIDIFGKVGEDPGNAWTDDASAGFTDANGGTWWTKRQTLIRKASVRKGVNMNPIVFNPTLEYDSLPDATYTGLGSHNCDCMTSSVNEKQIDDYIIHPNPSTKGSVVIITSKDEIKNVELINILGETVLTTNNNTIYTTNLNRGYYIVDIKFTDGRNTTSQLMVE